MATRQKPSQKQSIRDAILLLASLLNECGVPKFSVECFRLAKFDKCEAERDMWLLMYHVMQLLTFLEEAKTDFSLLCADSGWFLKSSEANLFVVSIAVREYLLTMGYTRAHFNTMHNVSTRELLLAWGWLICKQDLVPKLTEHFLSACKRIDVPLKDSHQSVLEQLINENEKMQSEMKDIISELTSKKDSVSELDKTVDAFHKLIWLKNSVSYKWKEMQRTQTAYQKVAYEIFQCTKSTRGSLSKQEPSGLCVDEVFLLRHPTHMKLHLRKLSKCASVLELVVQWRNCEPLWWQWMESVMDLQEEAELGTQLKGVELDDTCAVEKAEVFGDAQLNEAEPGNSKTQTNYLDRNKEDLVAEWSTLQHEMKGLLERNQVYMGKAHEVLEHKSRMVEQSLVNRQQQTALRQLQLECPCVGPLVRSTQPVVPSILGGLAPIDRPHFMPEGSRVGRPPQASGQYHKAGGTCDLIDACGEKDAEKAKLQALDSALDSCKSRVSAVLASMEKHLPPTLYKLNQVTNLRNAGTV